MKTPSAKIAYLTSSDYAHILLTVQTHDGEITQYEITHGHLANLVADGAKILAGQRTVTRDGEL